jgi:catechol 2,3-dioxygenase-like lactoylglutathione lyase family enzyme
MLRLPVLLCVAVQLGAVDLKVDHVTIGGRDLAALQKAFDSAGIPFEFGGKHTNGITEMAVASFPDGSYLELIAAQPGASVAKHYWGRFIEENAGVCAWAVSVKSVSGEAGRLKAAGFDITPAGSGRQRPDGVALRWTSASVGPGPQGSFFPFLIQDDTPRALRVYPHGAPSVKSIEGVAMVVVAVRDLDGAIGMWRKTFGLAEPRFQNDDRFQARLAWFPGTPVVLASGLGVERRLDRFGEAPFAVVLRSRVAPGGAKATWFGHTIVWFDPGLLNGAQVGVQVD